MRALDGELYTTATAVNSGPFQLTLGGEYLAEVVATFGGGSVELQKLGPDGATYISLIEPFASSATTPVEFDLIMGKFSSNGAKVLSLAAGTYKWVVTTATVVAARILRIPGE